MARVLIVDDSQIVTKMVGGFLSRKGFDVEVTNSPFGVSNRLREFRPQILLMDLGLPGLKGDKLLELCSTVGCEFRTIIVSSAEEKELKSVVAQGLAHDFFMKGAPLEQLEYKINQQILCLSPEAGAMKTAGVMAAG